ncbi:hypothetical protein L211DRAFT_834705, partial [Terfezia boudieri ATCC MYA-4762]
AFLILCISGFIILEGFEVLLEMSCYAGFEVLFEMSCNAGSNELSRHLYKK